MKTFEVHCLTVSSSQGRKQKLGVVKQVARGYTAVWVAERGPCQDLVLICHAAQFS